MAEQSGCASENRSTLAILGGGAEEHNLARLSFCRFSQFERFSTGICQGKTHFRI
jgi:hypothetical protein